MTRAPATDLHTPEGLAAASDGDGSPSGWIRPDAPAPTGLVPPTGPTPTGPVPPTAPVHGTAPAADPRHPYPPGSLPGYPYPPASGYHYPVDSGSGYPTPPVPVPPAAQLGYPPVPAVGYGPPPPAAPALSRSTVSSTALVLGLAALAVALVPVIGLIALPIGLVAIVLGVLGVALERHRGRAVAGALVGLVAIPTALVLTVVTSGGLFASDPEQVRSDVAQVQQLLDRGEYAQDDSVKVTFEDPDGRYADYTVENTTQETVASGLFVVDAIDAHGHVIASGWGEFESLDASGRASEYSSYVEFDAEVTHAETFEVRDLDAHNALYDEWFGDEDTTIAT